MHLQRGGTAGIVSLSWKQSTASLTPWQRPSFFIHSLPYDRRYRRRCRLFWCISEQHPPQTVLPTEYRNVLRLRLQPRRLWICILQLQGSLPSRNLEANKNSPKEVRSAMTSNQRNQITSISLLSPPPSSEMFSRTSSPLIEKRRFYHLALGPRNRPRKILKTIIQPGVEAGYCLFDIRPIRQRNVLRHVVNK